MAGVLGALLAAAGAPGIINGALPSGGNVGSSDWTLSNNGTYSTGDNAGGAQAGNWVTPASAAIAALYQVKVDVTSGAFSGGASTGVFLDLSTTRGWTKTATGIVVFTVTIREKASGIVRSVQTGETLTVV